MKSKKSILVRNQKVSKNRGDKWKKSLKIGRLNALRYPSEMRMKRVMMNLNQNDVAKEVGLSLATLGAIEKGTRRVSADRAESMAKVLRTPLKRIFEKQGEKFVAIVKQQR